MKDERVKKFAKNVRFMFGTGRNLGKIEKEMGISQGALSRIISKSGDMKLSTAILFSDRLGETIDDLINKDYEIIGKKKQIEELEAEIARLRSEIAEEEE